MMICVLYQSTLCSPHPCLAGTLCSPAPSRYFSFAKVWDGLSLPDLHRFYPSSLICPLCCCCHQHPLLFAAFCTSFITIIIAVTQSWIHRVGVGSSNHSPCALWNVITVQSWIHRVGVGSSNHSPCALWNVITVLCDVRFLRRHFLIWGSVRCGRGIVLDSFLCLVFLAAADLEVAAPRSSLDRLVRAWRCGVRVLIFILEESCWRPRFRTYVSRYCCCGAASALVNPARLFCFRMTDETFWFSREIFLRDRSRAVPRLNSITARDLIYTISVSDNTSEVTRLK